MAHSAPIRKIALGPAGATFTRREDGAILIRSPHALPAYPDKLTWHLEHWAAATPERIFMAQRDARWGLAHTELRANSETRARHRHRRLIDRGLSAERPVAILSGNDLEHALLALAAMHVGVPYAPISPAYSLISTDHAKLRFIAAVAHAGPGFRRKRRTLRQGNRCGGGARRRAGRDRGASIGAR